MLPLTDGRAPWRCRIIDNQADQVAEWTIDDEATQQKMLEHCRQASPYNQSFTIDKRVGYNGVQFFNQHETYTAFMGKMTHDSNGVIELKTDLGRKLEQLVLLNAPTPFRPQALGILTIDFD